MLRFASVTATGSSTCAASRSASSLRPWQKHMARTGQPTPPKRSAEGPPPGPALVRARPAGVASAGPSDVADALPASDADAAD
eukprot:8030781-Lingulodinium_polyedra.AAC.1